MHTDAATTSMSNAFSRKTPPLGGSCRVVPRSVRLLLGVVFLVFSAAHARAGIANTPLPQFADGKQSVAVLSVPGVVKRGRLQTDFLCTSLDSSPVDIGVEVFAPDGTLLNRVSVGEGAILNVSPGRTVTIGTSATATYLESAVIPLVGVAQGSARVVASSSQVRCNVMLVDNLVSPPVSLATLGEGVQPASGAVPSNVPLPKFSNGHQATHAVLVPGAVKKGDVETDFFCTSLASGNIDIGVQVLDSSGTVANNIAAGEGAALAVAPGATVTFGTTGTASLLEGTVIPVAFAAQGLARIVSNSGQLTCSALVLDAVGVPPAALSNLTSWGAGSGGAGVTLNSPLPGFSDGKPSVHVLTVPGVIKRGSLQTDFMCTSLSSTPVDIGVQIFGGDGTLLNDVSAGVGAVLGVAPGETVTIGTSATMAYSETTIIPLASGLQGAGRVVASSDQVRCNVMVVDDLTTPPAALATLGAGVQLVAGGLPAAVPLPQFTSGHQATHAAYFPGLVKRGDAETDVICTSLAAGSIDVGVEVFSPNGALAGSGEVLNVLPRQTVTFGTTGTAALVETTVIALTGVAQGMARVVSNSDQLICSALVLDAGNLLPTAMSTLVGYGATGGSVAAVCGNDIREGIEECDDGNLANGDGCDSNCKLECATTITGAKLKVTKLNTPPGDDKLLFTGSMMLPTPVSPAIDPQTNGARFFIESAGGVVVDVSVNPGAPWSENASRTKWAYSPDPGLKVQINAASSGLVKFKVKTKGGAYSAAAALPLTAFAVLTPAQCGKVGFTGPPAPSCTSNANQSTVKCK